METENNKIKIIMKKNRIRYLLLTGLFLSGCITGQSNIGSFTYILGMFLGVLFYIKLLDLIFIKNGK